MHLIARLIAENLSLRPWKFAKEFLAFLLLFVVFIFAFVAFVPSA